MKKKKKPNVAVNVTPKLYLSMIDPNVGKNKSVTGQYTLFDLTKLQEVRQMKYKIDHPREIVHEFTSIADSRKMYSLEQYLFKQREDGEVSKDGIIHLPNPLEIFSDE